jgi:hypothetical protein
MQWSDTLLAYYSGYPLQIIAAMTAEQKAMLIRRYA